MAFMRQGDSSPLFSSRAKIIYGDASVFEDLAEAVKDQDVVVSTIGHTKKSSKDVQTQSISNLVKVIEDSKQRTKVVSLTGTGVRQKGDKITVLDKLLNLAVRLIDLDRVNDGISHYQALKSSKVNWVIVRVLKLTNRGKIDFGLTSNGPAKTFVSRQVAAEALIRVAETETWDKQLPIVSSHA